MINSQENYLASFQDDDGLIKMTALECCKQPNSEEMIFRLRNNHKKVADSLLYPSHWARSVINRIVQDPTLSKLSSIRVSTHNERRNGAPIFGPISFESAIKAVIRENFVKSKFYIIEQSESSGFVGFACYLIVHLSRVMESNGQIKFHLEVWNGTEVDPSVYYIHSIFSKDDRYHQIDGAIIEHLDGAIIELNPLDKDYLFHHGKKIKGISYQKQFRLDGKIPIHILYEIAKIYFPIDTLTNEYFGLDIILEDNSIREYKIPSADF